MNPLDWLHWLTSDTGLMAVFAQNCLLGSLLIAAIIFVETDLVVMPFLPGDSLLFGAVAFLGVKGISPLPVVLVVTMAAIAGDAVNYLIGRSWLGQAIVKKGWVKQKHLATTRAYFYRYGGMTITLSLQRRQWPGLVRGPRIGRLLAGQGELGARASAMALAGNRCRVAGPSRHQVSRERSRAKAAAGL